MKALTLTQMFFFLFLSLLWGFFITNFLGIHTNELKEV